MTAPESIVQRFRAMTGGLPRPFWALFLGTFINRCGGFVVPFLSLYLTQARHLSPSQAGLVVATYGAGMLFAGPVGGYLADHIGRRATLVLALAGGGTGMIAVGFIHRIEVLAPAMFCVAIVNDMYRPAMLASVGDMVPATQRVRAFGLIYWVINLGVAVGLTAGGLLARISYRWLFIGDGATTLLFAFVVWLGVPETRPAHPAHAAPRSPWADFVAPYRDGPFVAFITLNFLFCLIFMQSASALPIDMAKHGLSPAAFGAILALNGLLIVFVQPFLSPVLARGNRSLTIAGGTLLAAIGFGMNAAARAPLLYSIAVVVWTIGEIASLPVASATTADLARPQIRGRYQGAHSLSFGLAASLAPILGTLVLQRLGGSVLWLGCLGLGVVAATGHVLLAPRLTRLRAERIATAAAPATSGAPS